ncbi:hypothetical protein DE146DRAFT_214539 [Phaeosphaeria sp. MPI-PUGE-AT-0046c]|nr:hypothetical protein DE146DRAFT_214539 [Phaeosphaeria sp. MPI-PUGE-AT-0046c]
MQQESPLSESGSTPQHAHSEAASSRITRKSHRKSRAGCTNCKTRRIKCDELKPHCTNCDRRQVQCSFSSYRPKVIPASIRDPGNTEELQLSQIELTYHWTTTTSHSLSAWWSGAAVWQSLLHDVALSHQHVLHLMFALSAQQLGSCRANRRGHYVALADRHYEYALRHVTQAMADMNEDNSEAILVSVQLICFVNWAKGPKEGEYLAFGRQERSDWLIMFRGVRTTSQTFKQHNSQDVSNAGVRKSRPIPSLCEPTRWEHQLSELFEHVFATSAPEEKNEYAHAVEILKECFESRYHGEDSEYHVVFAWLYKMSDKFLDRMQQHDPVPLIIYAHFVVLMQEMEQFWYMKGWTNHCMSGIYEALGKEHRPWIKWPMAKIGWIPP